MFILIVVTVSTVVIIIINNLINRMFCSQRKESHGFGDESRPLTTGVIALLKIYKYSQNFN